MSEIDCQQVLRDIDAFVDGELPATEAATLEAHLHACEGCLDRQEFRRAVIALVRRSCRSAEMPAELHVRVRRLLFRRD